MPARGVSRVAPIGKRFGRVTVISPSFAIGRSTAVTCRCDCGDERAYFLGNLQSQAEPMCPACRVASRPSKGGSGGHPLFNIWKAMIQRCENPNHDAYHRYGGRGVSICARWRNDFDAFTADVGERPSPLHTLDREDVDGNYEPSNCRWATPVEQQNNRSDNVIVEWQGRAMTIREASALSRVDHHTFAWRLSHGWTIEEAMTIPSMNEANKGRPKSRI